MFIMSNMMMFINEIVSQMFRVPAKPCSGDGSPGRPVTVALGEAAAGAAGAAVCRPGSRRACCVGAGARCGVRHTGGCSAPPPARPRGREHTGSWRRCGHPEGQESRAVRRAGAAGAIRGPRGASSGSGTPSTG